MKTAKKPASAIREKLLETAIKIFAEKGYREATVAEICDAAGANVAAINYHFGDKETLYAESWLLSFNRSLSKYPPDGGISADAPAEERFRGRIYAIIKRFANPESYEFEIITKELAMPTGLLEKVIQESIEPIRQPVLLIIRELMGSQVSEERMRLCHMSIMAQCMNLIIHERRRKMLGEAGMKTVLPENLTIEDIAKHIVDFSLAGIKKIRSEAENTIIAG